MSCLDRCSSVYAYNSHLHSTNHPWGTRSSSSLDLSLSDECAGWVRRIRCSPLSTCHRMSLHMVDTAVELARHPIFSCDDHLTHNAINAVITGWPDLDVHVMLLVDAACA